MRDCVDISLRARPKLASCCLGIRTVVVVVVAFFIPAALRAQPKQDCTVVAHSDHAHALLTNGTVNMFVFLPDRDRGYYNSSRFDWSGVVACATYQGHSYFGEWFDQYDPNHHDAIVGPVEEFRGTNGEIGYAQAAPGGLFVKIGVGVLRRIDASPYDFKTVYPVVDSGHWTVHHSRRRIVFVQQLATSLGVAYRYEKVLTLEANAPILHIEHHLKNLGRVSLQANVYDHDFFMLDRQNTGPEIRMTFPFHPIFKTALAQPARVEGNTIRFDRPLASDEVIRGTVFGGFSENVADYAIKTENLETGAGVLQTADRPLQNAMFWANSKTACAEAFIALSAEPNQSVSWTLTYQFLATKPKS